MCNEITLLGNRINGTTLTPKLKKIDSIKVLLESKDKKELQKFMGYINYYRKFIPNLATLFIPLQMSANITTKFIWEKE